MAGIYDWILNSLRVDESPLSNQVPYPVSANVNANAMPVPFQQMPSETGIFGKIQGPMRKMLLEQFLSNQLPNMMGGSQQATSQDGTTPKPLFVGNPPVAPQIAPMISSPRRRFNLQNLPQPTDLNGSFALGDY